MSSPAPPVTGPSAKVRRLALEDPAPLVIDGDVPLTYAELDRRADRIAQGLHDRFGLGDHRVALRLTSLPDLLVCLLGIHRAGMVVVCIDPTAPRDRAETVLRDAEAVLLVVEPDDPDRPEWDHAEVSALEADPQPGLADLADVPGRQTSIVFTSGSTGVPKGIVSVRSASDQMAWMLDHVPARPRMGTMHVGSVGGAAGLVHVLSALEATLVPYDVRRLGLEPMARWLLDQRVSLFSTVPTVLRFLLPTLPDDLVFPELRAVSMVGELLTPEDATALLRHLPPGALLADAYASSEAGLMAWARYTHDDLFEGAAHPPHVAVPGVRLRVVDEHGHDVAPGEIGEIVAEGDGVNAGYWRRPDLTERTFHDLPDGGRRCATGDAGRLLPDGSLELHGRLDHVVKVSGQRIELGEIEASLQELADVSAVAAAPYVDGRGDTRICAHVVGVPGVTLAPAVLRAALARKLPGYMLPARIRITDELPRLPGGKVDRRSLPAPTATRAEERPVTALGTELERSVGAIWARVLEVDHVGPDDDFFDLGGDSMRAAQLFVELEAQLGIVRPVVLLLEAPTLAELCALLRTDAEGHDVLVPVQPDGSRPPLVVLHGGFGDVFWVRRLAVALGPDQPVYAIRPPTDTSAVGSLEALCSLYLDAVRPVVDDGPAQLFGYSLGSLIAFEMATQLQAAGHAVGLLALGDLALAGERRRDDLETIDDLGVDRLDRVRRLPLRQAAPALARLVVQDPAGIVRWLGRRVRPDSELEQRLKSENLREARRLAHLVAPYAPSRRFDGPALLVRSAENAEAGDLGWGALVDGPLEIVDVACGHDELLDPPHIDAMAAALQHAMGAVTSGG